VCAWLETQGFRVTYLPTDQSGRVSSADLQAAITSETILISIMHVNNEIGTIQPIEAMGQIAHEHSIFFHVDGAQSAGKLPIDVRKMHIDLMSFSAHKIYGPKGMGALYASRKAQTVLVPQQQGGSQEFELRPGTLATHQIVGMGEAFALAKTEMAENQARLTRLNQQLRAGILQLSNVHIHGDPEHTLPNVLNIEFEGRDVVTMMAALPELAFTAGSACSTGAAAPSHVLTAIGCDADNAASSLRISIGKYTTEADVTQVLAALSLVA